MRMFRHRFWFVVILFGGACSAWAQPDTKARPNGVFDVDTILKLTIKGPVKKLLTDRDPESSYFPMTLSYKEADGSITAIDMKAKCRGHFRKSSENCQQPPILLNFPKNDTVKASIFRKMDKVKLVTTCRKGDYVMREYLVYKLQQQLTEKSFKTRLVEVQFEGDGLRKVDREPFLGFLIEDEEEMAKRCSGVVVDSPSYRPEQTNFDTYLRMTVFQYMIGNVDWSLPYRHNIKTIMPKDQKVPVVVAYDFDHSGLVDAPYANPPAELGMSSLRQRRYRGICIKDMNAYTEIINEFNALKPAFYKVYEDCKLVDENYKKRTFKFLDDFYETINNPKKLEDDFGYPCRNGTQNIIIGGMKVNPTQ